MSNAMVTADRLDYQRAVQSEPLTEREIQTIHRFLADPTVFPREFKRWVTEHSSDTVDIAKTQVHGLVNSTGQVVIGGASMEMLGGVLVGCVLPYPGDAPPPGWFLCDGHEELKAPIQTLADMLGTKWGTPSSGDRVVLPDFRRRVLFGAGTGTPVGTTDGLSEGSRNIQHRHTVTEQPHTHQLYESNRDSGDYHGFYPGWNYNFGEKSPVDSSAGSAHRMIDPASTGLTVGPSGTPLDSPSYATLNYIIGSGKVPT